MPHELHLAGCTPTPLASYLKALGALRLVAEQTDPEALGWWSGEHFVLESDLDKEELARSLLEEYRPTPIVAPWNGGSGFYPKDNHKGIGAIEKGNAKRTEQYRAVIAQCRDLITRRSLFKRPVGEEKHLFLEALRNELPDSVLTWFDAAVMLSTTDAKYPPLLGTGGNDGRLDFTNNFMQRLVELFDPGHGRPTADACRWLIGSLFGRPTPGLSSGAIGQFSPGGVGGPNATTGFSAASLVNPWDYVLMLEGTLLFASATTRRLEDSDPGTLSYPFTVRATVAGTGSASMGEEQRARGEIWLPIWSSPVTLSELRAVLSEGRVTLGRWPARDGLDFTRAVAALGVDRGIDSFERYIFHQRSGRAYLATPVGRMRVRRNPAADLISDLDRGGFLRRLRRVTRRDDTPSRLKQLTRRLEDALFSLTRQYNPELLQAVLILLGDIQRAVGASAKVRDTVPPLPRLSPEWMTKADDRSDEFRLAASLAGLYARRRRTDSERDDRSSDGRGWKKVFPMRVHMAPIEIGRKRDGWDPDSHLAVWGPADLPRNLVDVLERRLLEADRLDYEDKPLFGRPPVDLAAVTAFLKRETDDDRIAALLGGLSLARAPRWLPARSSREETGMPAAFAVLKPFFVPDSVLIEARLLPADTTLGLPMNIVARLRADDVPGATRIAWQRLRGAKVKLPDHPRHEPAAPYPDGARLAAALMAPLDLADLIQVSRRSGLERIEKVVVDNIV